MSTPQPVATTAKDETTPSAAPAAAAPAAGAFRRDDNFLMVGGRYRLKRKVGSGSFGDIYLGRSFACITLAVRYCACACRFFRSLQRLCAVFPSVSFVGVNVSTGEDVAVKLVSCVIT